MFSFWRLSLSFVFDGVNDKPICVQCRWIIIIVVVMDSYVLVCGFVETTQSEFEALQEAF